jgi:hypothetical protein
MVPSKDGARILLRRVASGIEVTAESRKLAAILAADVLGYSRLAARR